MEIITLGRDGILPIIDFNNKYAIVIKDEFDQSETCYYLLNKDNHHIMNLLTYITSSNLFGTDTQEICQYALTYAKPVNARSCIMLLSKVEYLELIKQIHGAVCR